MSPVDRFAVELSMAFGIGRAPKAPGTFGSLPGLALMAGIHPLLSRCVDPTNHVAYWGSVVAALLLITAIAYWAIDRAEKVLATHDDQRIVIDEVAGQAIAAAFVPVSWIWYLAAFGLFRLFDITKPLIIGKVDRDAPGALGTLGDDLLAGLAGAVILIAIRSFWF